MDIVAINDGHNASVALLRNGQIHVALQEERITRVKNQYGFPRHALEYVMSSSNTKPSSVDHFVYCSKYSPLTSHESRDEHIRAYKKSLGYLNSLKQLSKRLGAKQIVAARTRAARAHRLIELGILPSQIDFAVHHECHAASAYYGQGLFNEPVLVLTNDGAGDDLCATVSVGFEGKLSQIAATHMDHSIGELWAVTTALMGMVPLEHEYKLMGLAPYASHNGVEQVKAALEGMFRFEGNGLTWTVQRPTPPVPYIYDYLRDKLEFMRFDWVAGGLQQFTEDFLLRWVQACIRATGIKRLALAGGTFMNVKLNKRISELDEVKSVFVFPSCGDETNPFGACYLKFWEVTGNAPAPLKDLYLGRAWFDDDITAEFQRFHFKKRFEIRAIEQSEIVAANLLAQGNVIAWFNGREEFGARALGARSILADPTKPGVVREINSMVKCRDFWMPFAASMLEEDADRYLINPKKIAAPYMITTFDTRHSHEIAAAVHPEDRTCRPQVVDPECNPAYHGLLVEFKRLTGRGAILNTSFNLHGLPIASTPADAFQVLDNSDLRYLVMDKYLITKVD